MWRNSWRTHVISEPPDRLWSLATIFCAADFLAAFFEFPIAAVGKEIPVMWTPTYYPNTPKSVVPVSDRDSSRQLRVNSLLCVGPASIKTVYSGRRHPLRNANSWVQSAISYATQRLMQECVGRFPHLQDSHWVRMVGMIRFCSVTVRLHRYVPVGNSETLIKWIKIDSNVSAKVRLYKINLLPSWSS